MDDYTVVVNRIGVDHGYNHDIETHSLAFTTFNEKLTEELERKARGLAQLFFPTTVQAGSLSRSYPLSNQQLPSVKNPDGSWTHTWHIKYYKPGND